MNSIINCLNSEQEEKANSESLDTRLELPYMELISSEKFKQYLLLGGWCD